MTALQSILEQLSDFKPGTRARSLFYLRTGVLEGDAHHTAQATLDHWVSRIEKFGPRAREKVLAKLEGASEPMA
jgi:hypothetical protein